VEVRFGPLLSHFDGRLNTIDVTVINHGITPAIEGGQSYIQNNPDGGIQWVTLLGVRHNVVPLALIENAPLWKATITTSDGYVWVFPVGCVYLDILNHTGYEPTGPNTGFDWTVYDESGFYDCGNGYKATPPDIGLGGSATVPLHIYLHHPRLWELEPPPNRRVVRIDIGLYRSDGAWLGTVGSATY
jgi:hypothetical protein